jgi:hypothetical protein
MKDDLPIKMKLPSNGIRSQDQKPGERQDSEIAEQVFSIDSVYI